MESEVHTITWVNNERLVYEIAERRLARDGMVATGELMGMDFDSKRHELLYGYRASDEKLGTRLSNKKNFRASQDIISLLKNDPKHVLIVEYPWSQHGNEWYDDRVKNPIISRLNVYTGKRRRIEGIPFPKAQVIADELGNINFLSWQDAQGNIKAAYRNDKKSPWDDVDIGQHSGLSLKPIRFDKKNKLAYLKGVFGKEGYQTIYRLNLSNKQLTPLFTDLKSDISYWDFDPVSNVPSVAVSSVPTPNYHYFGQSQSVQDYKVLSSAFNGQSVRITSRSRDGKKALVHVSSDINPGEFYYFDSKTKKADFIWANRSWIDPADMSHTLPITFSARDGLTIHGYLTPAKNIDPKDKPPLIVLPHGGPHGVYDDLSFDPEVQLFANRGYSVLQLNFRGSGGFGSAFAAKGYRQWGGKMIDDILDGIEWATQHHSIDASNICIYGATYGGYAAMMSAVKSSDTFKCAVGYVGIYDLEYLYTKGNVRDSWGGESFLEKAIGRDEAELERFSPVHQVSKINVPVMLIHSAQDNRAPIQHSLALRKGLKKTGKKNQWLKFSQRGHGTADVKERKKRYSELLAFFDRYLK